MTVTTLDPRSALIVVDLQKGIVSLPTAHPAGDVVKQVRKLADAFRGRGLPVVLVNVAGGAPGRTEQQRPRRDYAADWAELIPELGRQPQDHLVTKHTLGAFTNTDLDAWLKAAGVTQVVVAGIATSIGVETTARQAYELGFNVTLATDAMTDLQADPHAYSIAHVFPRIGETGTTQEIIALLERSA
ncbi:isochorismatase family protein [Ancylobacter mangrovi]|uniref:isochorismatase family protein n=1 Tax=Ancylobacter mangrovi TaxID=2972472 RepID=UPI0021627197|nr:isochorismatase family protein [Ancylobacter mangrovi]MCS0502063.1 isochorismatase family protein [Ancylobacter mangrovi]